MTWPSLVVSSLIVPPVPTETCVASSPEPGIQETPRKIEPAGTGLLARIVIWPWATLATSYCDRSRQTLSFGSPLMLTGRSASQSFRCVNWASASCCFARSEPSTSIPKSIGPLVTESGAGVSPLRTIDGQALICVQKSPIAVNLDRLVTPSPQRWLTIVTCCSAGGGTKKRWTTGWVVVLVSSATVPAAASVAAMASPPSSVAPPSVNPAGGVLAVTVTAPASLPSTRKPERPQQ